MKKMSIRPILTLQRGFLSVKLTFTILVLNVISDQAIDRLDSAIAHTGSVPYGC